MAVREYGRVGGNGSFSRTVEEIAIAVIEPIGVWGLCLQR